MKDDPQTWGSLAGVVVFALLAFAVTPFIRDTMSTSAQCVAGFVGAGVFMWLGGSVARRYAATGEQR